MMKKIVFFLLMVSPVSTFSMKYEDCSKYTQQKEREKCLLANDSLALKMSCFRKKGLVEECRVPMKDTLYWKKWHKDQEKADKVGSADEGKSQLEVKDHSADEGKSQLEVKADSVKKNAEK